MNTALQAFPTWLTRTSLVTQIALGLACGIALALVAPDAARATALLGELFVAALKAVAPVLVLVAAAVASHQKGQPTHVRPILVRYLASTFAAAQHGRRGDHHHRHDAGRRGLPGPVRAALTTATTKGEHGLALPIRTTNPETKP